MRLGLSWSAVLGASCVAAALVATGCEKKERHEAKEDVKETAGEVGAVVGKATDKAGELGERGLEKGKELAHDTAESLDTAKDEAGDALDDAGEAAERGADKAGDAVEKGLHEAGEDLGLEKNKAEIVITHAGEQSAKRLSSCDLSAPTPIFFDGESSRVEGSNFTRGKTLGDCLMGDQQGDTKVTVSGHAAPSGDADADVDLGMERAQNVAQILINQGVDASRITIESEGGGEYLEPSERGFAERVDVYVTD